MPSSEPQSQSSGGFNTFLRSLGLQSINPLSGLNGKTERAKVALYRDRRIAALHLSMHILPIFGAMTLIILNSRGAIVHPSNGYQFLQFVAKILEIMMQASIASIILMYTRYLLVLRKAAPFGILFAGIRSSSISYLWSLEFFGTLTAKWMPARHRAQLASLLVSLVLLANIVGPSSAILAIPRPGKVFLGSIEIPMDGNVAYPMKLAGNLIGHAFPDFILPHFDNASMGPELSRTLYLEDQMEITYLGGSAGGPAASLKQFAIPMNMLYTFIWFADYGQPAVDLMLRANSILIRSLTPTTVAACSEVQTQATNPDIEFPIPGQAAVKDLVTFDQIQNKWNASLDSQMFWISPPPHYEGNVSLFAIYAETNSTRNVPLSSEIRVVPCTMKAAWIDGAINVTQTAVKEYLASSEVSIAAELTSYPTDQFIFPDWNTSNLFMHPVQPVAIDPDWAHENMLLQDTAASYLLRDRVDITGLVNCLAEESCSDNLALVLAGALASLMRDLNLGGRQEALFTPHPGSSYPLLLSFHNVGLGYTLDSGLARLALFVLVIYVLVAVSGIAYCLGSGLSSYAWDSDAEVATLALKSNPPPSRLGKVTAGLETFNVFREPIAILANEDEELEIVFESESSGREVYKELEINRPY